MAAITPIKYAETSTGGVRNPMRDFVSNLPNIYNQYLTILDRNRQRKLQDAQFAESKRQFEETQKLNREQFVAQNLQNLMSNTVEQQKVAALNQANQDNRQYQRDMLDYTKGEPARRINEKMIDFYLNSFGIPSGLPRGLSSSSSSSGKIDTGLDTRIQKQIDYYYSLAKDIDTLSTYIAKLKNTSNDSEFNEWFSGRPKEEQDELIRYSAFTGKKIGEKINYADLAASLSEQLDKKHSQAQSVYENMANFIDNTNKSLGWPAYNKPVNLFPEKDPKVIRQKYEEALLEQENRNAENMKRRIEAEKLRKMIEETAFGSKDTSLGNSMGKPGTPFKPQNSAYSYSYDNTLGDKGTVPIFPNPVNMTADYPRGLQRTDGGASALGGRGTSPATLAIGNPGDPYYNVYDPYFSGGNNVYEQYLKTLKTGKNR